MSNLFSSSRSTPSTENDVPTTSGAREHPLFELIYFALIAVIIVVPIRFFIAQPFIVSGASMTDTFHNGDYLIVDQVSYYFNDPVRGEVVIFRYPKDPSKHFIKRVIGIPGDTVRITGNRITITNEANPTGFTLDEPYITSMSPENLLTETLGEREYFVMGDNRDHSSDSRAWGVLQKERIVGRAWLRLFPPQDVAYLPGTATYQIPNDDVVSQ